MLKERVYLIVHGFNGNPGQLKYLDEYLRANELDTRVILLDGHGGTKKNAARVFSCKLARLAKLGYI